MTRTDYVLSQIVCLMAVLGFDRSLKIPMFFMSRQGVCSGRGEDCAHSSRMCRRGFAPPANVIVASSSANQLVGGGSGTLSITLP